MCATCDERCRSLRAEKALDDLGVFFTSWRLAQDLGEDESTVDRLGFAFYDEIERQLDVPHDSIAALLIAHLMVRTGDYSRAAARMLSEVKP